MLNNTAFCYKCDGDEVHTIKEVSNGQEWTCTKCGYTRTYGVFVMKPTPKYVKIRK